MMWVRHISLSIIELSKFHQLIRTKIVLAAGWEYKRSLICTGQYRSGFISARGWSGGAKVLDNFLYCGVLPKLAYPIGQGPTVLSVSVGGGYLDTFSLVNHISLSFTLSLGDDSIETKMLSQRAVFRN